jgi:hypothetical protein
MPYQPDNMPTQQVIAGAPLVTPRGDPIPPQDVVQRLREIDRGLSIQWVAGAMGTHYFGLFQRWRESDRRWESVRAGEVQEKDARDLVTMFPPECPPASMAAWVEYRWGPRAIPKDPAKEAERIVEASMRQRQSVDDAVVDRVTQTGLDRFEREDTHDRLVRAGLEKAHPMVPGGFERTEPKRLIALEK